MSKITKWCQDKPIVLAIFAPQIASLADATHELLTLAKRDETLSLDITPPSLDDWLPLYRQHREILAFLRRLFSLFNFGNLLILLSESLSKGRRIPPKKLQKIWRRLPQTTKVKIIHALNMEAQSFLVTSLQDIDDDLNSDLPPEIKAQLLPLLQSPEATFFYKVWAPCLLLYATPPGKLLHRAYLGDLDAMEKLLRLDSSLVHDPRIGRVMHRLRFSGRKGHYENLMAALARAPKSKVTPQKVKVTLAAMISALADKFKQPLTDTDIHALFDAIAEDSGRGLVDPDLELSKWAFSKAVKRDKPFWLKALTQAKPDKK